MSFCPGERGTLGCSSLLYNHFQLQCSCLHHLHSTWQGRCRPNSSRVLIYPKGTVRPPNRKPSKQSRPKARITFCLGWMTHASGTMVTWENQFLAYINGKWYNVIVTFDLPVAYTTSVLSTVSGPHAISQRRRLHNTSWRTCLIVFFSKTVFFNKRPESSSAELQPCHV